MIPERTKDILKYCTYFIILLLSIPFLFLFIPKDAGAACFARIDLIPSSNTIPIISDDVIDAHEFKILITNMGSESITLVEPGDGSQADFRTPLVSWSVEDDGGPVIQKFMLFDDQINHLEPGEVFTLPPAGSHEFTGYIPEFLVHGPGQYQVEFHYKNEPKREWTGIPMGQHDPATMRQVRDSTPCDVTSAPVRFEAIVPTPQSHE